MNKLVTKLSDDLIPVIKKAEEVWIAVALLKSAGLKLVRDNLPVDCIQHYLIGVDLPTEPKALWTLFELQLKATVSVNLYTGKEYFHPKLYLIRVNNSFKVFVGSANCTNAGLNDNIELSISIDDQEIGKQLKEWFDKLSSDAKPLTKNFLQNYEKEYLDRRARERDDEQAAKKEKQELNEEHEAKLSERNRLIRVLKNYRLNTKEYNEVVVERNQTVQALRQTLDYPNFSNINVDGFFDIWELGHIIALPKPTIKREIDKFSRLLSMLCDEQVDIVVRYNRALEGDLKIRGVNEGLISKLLVIHNPELYFVKNDKSMTALKKYGIELPRGLSKGEQYKIMCRFLKQICKETQIENLAVLDYYLYLEVNKDNI